MVIRLCTRVAINIACESDAKAIAFEIPAPWEGVDLLTLVEVDGRFDNVSGECERASGTWDIGETGSAGLFPSVVARAWLYISCQNVWPRSLHERRPNGGMIEN